MIPGPGHLWPVFFNLAVRTDPDGGPNDAHNLLAVHFLFSERAILGHHLFFRIAQKGEWNVVFGDELLVRCFAVGGNAHNGRIEFQEFAVKVTESLGFLLSPGGIVFWIKVKYEIFTFNIL